MAPTPPAHADVSTSRQPRPHPPAACPLPAARRSRAPIRPPPALPIQRNAGCLPTPPYASFSSPASLPPPRSVPSARGRPPAPATCAAFSSSTTMAAAADNPLLAADFDFPPFDRVEPSHVRPGIRHLLTRLESELEELEKAVQPSWGKLVEPLERITDRLEVIWGMVDHLKAVKDSADLRTAVEEVQPDKVKFQLRLGQSKPIYEAFKAIRNSSDWDTLSDARKHIVEAQIKKAVLSGVALEDEQREKFNQIEQELEKLSQKFSKNVLEATKKCEILITDKKEIDGLPATALGFAAQTAVSKGHENATAEHGPWVITLDAPSYIAVMQHARNRALREEVYRSYLTRASSGELDNTDIISQILKLRLEKAKILGYKSYAEVSMAQKMATVERVQELLEKLRAASWDHAVKDMEDLKIFAKDSGSPEATDLTHWDLMFWSERLRESKYDINEEALRPYFALPKVMDGLFTLANNHFGVTVEPADGLAPVWHSDVKFYCVKDSSNSPVAYFYFDPYSRPSEKCGGAWMNVVFSRSRVLARNGLPARLHVAHMVCNQTPPVGDKPSLMTFREVESVFHEFGHALQHMLTKQDEGFVAGVRGVEWDAVELPSQFKENWCYHKDTLLSIAKHYETGETLPEEIYAKLVAAKNFCAGTFRLSQIRFASVDMELHTTYDPYGSLSIYDVDRRVAERTQVLAPLLEDRFLCSFSHIFAGGYAAGYYYSYKDIDEVFSLSPAKMLPQSKPRWSDLPIDIMGKLMEYLNSLEDHASLLAVCRNWRACVEECRFWRAPAYLLLPGGMMYGYPDFTPRYLNGSKGYSGSCEGSLLFSESGVDGPRHLLKYPPFTGFPWLLPRLFVTIRRGCGGSDGGSLLSQWWNDAKTMDVRKLVRCSDNTIAAILGSEYSARVAIYWTSRHVWFLADDQLRCYEDLAFCDGRLYALTVMEELWAFDIGNVNDGVGAAELIIRGPLPGHRVSAARYLVRSCASNALLMIRRQLELWPSHENAQVSVFRADLASSQWVEVTDLGGEALLVGRPCSRAVPAPAHDMEGTSRNVVKGNTILFATVDRVALPSLQGVSIYDMRNGVVKLRRVVRTNGPDSATWLFPREEFRLR